MNLNDINEIKNSNSENSSKHDIFPQNLKSPLTKEQEQELFLKYSKGDQEAKLEIFERNLRLVVKIAKKYIGSTESLCMEDLFQEGSIGLMNAIENFDLNKGYKLSTYATWWIRQSIIRAINNTDSFVRLPVYISEDIQDFKAAVKVLTNKLKRIPTNEELAWYLGSDVDEIEKILATIYKVFSLNVCISENDEESILQDFILSDENIEENIINKSKKESINYVLDTVLTPKENKILKLRYGLVDGNERTLEEVGKVFDLTRERIRQIESKAINKIKSSKEYKTIEDYKEIEPVEYQKVYRKQKNFIDE